MYDVESGENLFLGNFLITASMKLYLCLPLSSEYVDKMLVEHIKLNIYLFLSPLNTKMHFKFMSTNFHFKNSEVTEYSKQLPPRLLNSKGVMTSV